MIEAAASGVPVVASGSRTGGGVVVPGETGVLVDNFGVETLADAVAELLAEPDRRERFGRRARVHAEQLRLQVVTWLHWRIRMSARHRPPAARKVTACRAACARSQS